MIRIHIPVSIPTNDCRRCIFRRRHHEFLKIGVTGARRRWKTARPGVTGPVGRGCKPPLRKIAKFTQERAAGPFGGGSSVGGGCGVWRGDDFIPIVQQHGGVFDE